MVKDILVKHHQHLRKRILKNKEQELDNKIKFLDLLVYIAGLFLGLMTIPQILKIWVEKNASGVSLITWVAFLIVGLIMVAYGIAHKEKPIYTNDGMGIQAGALLNYYVSSRIEICLEPMYAQSKIQLEYESGAISGFATSTANLTPDHFENQSYFYIPLTGTYEIPLGNFRPYGRLGGMMGLMFTNTTSTSQGIFQGPDEENMDNRNTLNYWVVTGAGVKYKLNKGYFYFDARYNIGLNIYLNSGENRFQQPNHNWVYMYQDSDFRVNSFMVSFGYVRSFYNPKRVRN